MPLFFFFEWIGEKGGCIIIDSTRKGKKFPDSMSKTIPIWCCVLNRSIYNHLKRLCNTNDPVSYIHVTFPALLVHSLFQENAMLQLDALYRIIHQTDAQTDFLNDQTNFFIKLFQISFRLGPICRIKGHLDQFLEHYLQPCLLCS